MERLPSWIRVVRHAIGRLATSVGSLLKPMRPLLKPRWLVVPAIIALALVIFLRPIVPPPVTSVRPQALYLLSAMAQSLAALAALVFAISLLVIQLSTRYSQAAALVSTRSGWGLAFFGPFVVAIFLSLKLLADEQPPVWQVQLAIVSGGAAVLLLVPYFLQLREDIDPIGPVRRVGQIASRTAREFRTQFTGRLTDGLSDLALRCIQQVDYLEEMALRAFSERDYRTGMAALWALRDVALEANKFMNFRTPKGPVQRIRDIGAAFVSDPRVAGTAVEALYECLNLREDTPFPDEGADRVVGHLRVLGIGAAKVENSDPALEAINRLSWLGRKALGQATGTATEVLVLAAIEEIGATAAAQRDRPVVEQAVHALVWVAVEALRGDVVRQSAVADAAFRLESLHAVVDDSIYLAGFVQDFVAQVASLAHQCIESNPGQVTGLVGVLNRCLDRLSRSSKRLDSDSAARIRGHALAAPVGIAAMALDSMSLGPAQGEEILADLMMAVRESADAIDQQEVILAGDAWKRFGYESGARVPAGQAVESVLRGLGSNAENMGLTSLAEKAKHLASTLNKP